MLLLICATEMEMQPVRKLLNNAEGLDYLVCGVGPVDTAMHLAKYFATQQRKDITVINFGVAGAYLGKGIAMLDICFAEKEILAEVGINDGIQTISFAPEELSIENFFELDKAVLSDAEKVLRKNQILHHIGTFLTVAGVSGTQERGNLLATSHNAICENMEGAAAARVCGYFDKPLLEVRCVSNFVENRDKSKWQLAKAIDRSAEIAALLATHLNQS